MPTLQFKGKNIIWNHHLSVPYHTLEEVQELHFQPEKGNGNLIIEGDNLIALKALLPEYAGKVKCIYIDPPYNTGNDNGQGKGWIYNDNVNSPLINEWINKEVNIDDLTRHDKWLCMMTPRLKMLRDLLSEDGVLFMSIEDNEFSNLKILSDEIYGNENFIGRLIWKKKKQPSFLASHISYVTEIILVYGKNKNLIDKLSIDSVTDDTRRIDNATNEKSSRTIKKGILVKKDIPIIRKGKYLIKTMELEFKDDVIIENNRTQNSFEVIGNFRNKQSDIDKFCDLDLLYITSTGGFRRLPTEEEKTKNKNIVDLLLDWGDNQDSDKEINELFDKKPFDYPKPIKLIKNLIKSCTYNEKSSIILDSFAGSGTTMQAVNELNKEDGGNRKCILVQMKEDSKAQPDKNICQNITRERNKLAIEKVGYESGFKYLKVGTAIDPEKMLEGQLPTYEQFAKYIYYLGTGEHLADAQNINAENHFVGTHGAKAFYLIYEQDVETLTRLALNLSIAEDIVKNSPNKRRVIYAPACFLDSDYMEEKQIEFVSIPYNLFERQTN